MPWRHARKPSITHREEQYFHCHFVFRLGLPSALLLCGRYPRPSEQVIHLYASPVLPSQLWLLRAIRDAGIKVAVARGIAAVLKARVFPMKTRLQASEMTSYYDLTQEDQCHMLFRPGSVQANCVNFS